MKRLIGFEHGMGLGGWLTNYKRMAVVDPAWRKVITTGDEEHFDRYITREDVKNIKSFGADHVRLGFDQMVVEEYEKPFSYRERGLAHLDDFISWCREEGLNVMLNLHKGIGAYCEVDTAEDLLTDESLRARFVRLWDMLEDRYHGENHVAFELLNEVKNNAEGWNTLCAQTVDAIRAKNPLRKIVVGSVQWNSPDCLKDLALYDDENVVYTFHFYTPFLFTHQRGLLQGAMHVMNRELPYPGDAEIYRETLRELGMKTDEFDGWNRVDRTYLESALRGAIDFVREHPDKILYCGEFGIIRHCRPEWRENWFRDVISILKENGMPYCAWNYLSTPYDGNRFSLVDDDARRPVSAGLFRAIWG